MRFMKNEGWLARPLAVLAMGLLAGCSDDLPTAGGADRFPGGASPTTIEILLTRADVLAGDAVYDNFADPLEAPYLLVAEDFDGELDAHALARFRDFPVSVTYSSAGTTVTDSVFEYVSGELTTVIDSSATSTPDGRATLHLWELAEPWDSTSVTWESAAEGDPWSVPGGTPGELLASGIWTRGDTLIADTVVWQLDSLAVRRLAQEGAHGVMVTSAVPGSRVQFGAMRLSVTVRPESTPDTTITRDVGSAARNFIFTPPPPAPEGVFRVGGVTSARTVFRLDLSSPVPGCADPAAEACPTVSLRDVSINLAEMVLEPLQVPSGFRPVDTSPLLVRRVVEPELGRLAPLGEALVSDTISASRFDGTDPEPVRINITTAVRRVVRMDEPELAFALLGVGARGGFGYQWYVGEPVLRVVYTLPNTPRLP